MCAFIIHMGYRNFIVYSSDGYDRTRFFPLAE